MTANDPAERDSDWCKNHARRRKRPDTADEHRRNNRNSQAGIPDRSLDRAIGRRDRLPDTSPDRNLDMRLDKPAVRWSKDMSHSLRGTAVRPGVRRYNAAGVARSNEAPSNAERNNAGQSSAARRGGHAGRAPMPEGIMPPLPQPRHPPGPRGALRSHWRRSSLPLTPLGPPYKSWC